MSLEWHKAGHDEGECGGEMACPWCRIQELEAENKRQALLITDLTTLAERLEQYEAVRAESEGVAGYHLNGDIAYAWILSIVLLALVVTCATEKRPRRAAQITKE